MSKMRIHVEFLPGTSFHEAVREASDKAGELDVSYVIFNFNDTSVSVQPGCSIQSIDRAWQEYLDGSKHIIVKG